MKALSRAAPVFSALFIIMLLIFVAPVSATLGELPIEIVPEVALDQRGGECVLYQIESIQEIRSASPGLTEGAPEYHAESQATITPEPWRSVHVGKILPA